MRNPLYELYRKRGRKQGIEKGLARGLARGREEGREEGREKERVALMRFQFERRLGRRLIPGERRKLSELLAREGARKVGAAVLELSVKELASYIAPPGLPPKAKGRPAKRREPCRV